MVVSELKTELEAQGLPTDGTRQVLYQRVQKARRINRSRGIPLWVPPVEDEEEVCNMTMFIVNLLDGCSVIVPLTVLTKCHLHFYFCNLTCLIG